MFFALEGKFHITEGTPYSVCPTYEYTEDEIKTLPDGLQARLDSILDPYKAFEKRRRQE
jgi:hypothetical protein